MNTSRARGKILFGIIAGTASVGIDGLAGLVNIHLLLEYLPESVAGIWLLMLTLGGFLLLPQNGAAMAINRFIAQSRESLASRTGKVEIDLGPVHHVTRFLAVVVLGGAVLAYAVYLVRAANAVGLGLEAPIPWCLYSVGVVVGLAAYARFACLDGLGEVGWDRACRTLVSVLGMLLFWGALRASLGLVGISGAFLVQNLLMYYGAGVLLSRFSEETKSPHAKQDATGRRLLIETGKLASLGLIGYLVMNCGAFIVERKFGARSLALYLPLTRVGSLLVTVSCLIPQMFYPYVARSWAAADFVRHRRLFVLGAWAAIVTYGISAALVWLASPVLFPMWLGKGHFLGLRLFGTVLFCYGILVANAAFTNPVLASVGHAFVTPSIINAASVGILTWVLVAKFGLLGVPLGIFAGSLLPSIWVIYRSTKLMLERTASAPGSKSETTTNKLGLKEA